MPQLGVMDGGGGGGGWGTAPPTLPAPGPVLGPVCWMRLQLPIPCWDPPLPVGEVRLGAGAKEQLLDCEEDGVAEFEEDEADDEEAEEAPAITADIPPPFPVPPMVES